MAKSIVIALGGNALLDPSVKQSFSKENRNIDNVSHSIAELSKKGYKIVVTHGNGSQVGDEIMRNEHAREHVPKLPLYILNSETQASIGTVIETSLLNSFAKLNIKRDVCVNLVHVLVNEKDPAFKRPEKRVGPFYTKKELDKELALDRFSYIKSGSKYRRVVPSPRPISILELDAIKRNMDKSIVITCGGGGVPVIRKKGILYGIDAVIDKDLTSQLLATSIKADTLIILTNADYVYDDSRKKDGGIKEVTAKDLRKRLSYLEEGTIRPKVEACIRFVENGGKEAYIGNFLKLDLILQRKSGTRITLLY
jgi:carbamate kinase